MSTDIWLFEEPPRRLSQIERRSCQLQRELEHWLFLPTLSMSQLSKKRATSVSLKSQIHNAFKQLEKSESDLQFKLSLSLLLSSLLCIANPSYILHFLQGKKVCFMVGEQQQRNEVL